ncbi:hypothetical protein [Vibrio vulnificus]|uniref:hypothetical protein n=1 Tax=Vibrio vulnificus TaxID=672 RepID=UPI0005F18AE8|nr:hypothetical protein [Vibrio vulnificus]
MKFDVYEFLTGLVIENIEFYIPRPVGMIISSGDVDIIIYKKDISNFESYLNGKYGSFKKMDSRFAFSTTEYILGDISIDVKKAICFGERKQIVSKVTPSTKSLKIIDGYIYPDNEASDNLFLTVWLLHLVLDKRNPCDSSTYHLFENYLNKVGLDLSIINELSIVDNEINSRKFELSDFNQLRDNLLENLKLKNKVTSYKLMLFLFRCYFYLRRRFLYGKK